MTAVAQAVGCLVQFFDVQRVDCLDQAMFLLLSELKQSARAEQEAGLALLTALLATPAPMAQRVSAVLTTHHDLVLQLFTVDHAETTQLLALRLLAQLAPHLGTAPPAQLRAVCMHLVDYILALLTLPLADTANRLSHVFGLFDQLVALPTTHLNASVILAGLLLDQALSPTNAVRKRKK